MKRKLKRWPKILILVLILFLLVFLIIYKIEIDKVSTNNDIIEIEIKQGSTYTTISKELKKNNLIKSEFWYKMYIKLNQPNGLQAGTYNLSSNMSIKELVEKLSTGTINSGNYINITFKEGINMRRVISLITEKTNITEEQILNKLSDYIYLNKLIEKYWFLSDEIKNEKIYYSLEGYLYPDTYQVKVDGNIEDIIETMLNNLEQKLKPYKEKIEKSKYSFHKLLTLSSIVELEAANSDDRNGVAGVFYNRLSNNWALGSDVTTYYGAKVEMSERDLYLKELNEVNDYNTRSASMAGKLPIGPVCNPSIDSIEAVINPKEHNYFYFVADKNKKTYFTKTENEHVKKVAELKNSGLWYEY